MDLLVANHKMETATFAWTGTANCMLVCSLCIKDSIVEHKNLNVKTSIRIRPLNALALNEPSKFRSKKSGSYNPLSWAHKRRGLLARDAIKPCTAIDMEHICCQCHIKITASSLFTSSIVQYNVNCIKRRITSIFVSMSILATSMVL